MLYSNRIKESIMRLLFSLLFVVVSLWAEVVVIASEGENVNASVSADASRCDYYFIVNEKGKVLKSMKNPHRNVSGGASSHLIELLRIEQASHFIAARMGMKLENALITNKITYMIFNGSVNEAITNNKK